MPHIIAEAFARGLLNNIMIEAFDVLDINSKKSKRERAGMRHQSELPVNSEQNIDSGLQLQREHDDHSNLEQMEKMLHNLCDVGIGEPSSVLPRPLTILEDQVKRTIQKISEALRSDTIGTTGTYIIRGQGDVQKPIVPPEVEDLPNPVAEVATVEKNEATNFSTNLLREMIEELEENSKDLSIDNLSDSRSTSKEVIAILQTGEETQERFQRGTDEDRDYEESIVERIPMKVESMTHCLDLENEDSKMPTTALASTSFVRHTSLEEVAIKEACSSLSPTSAENTTTSDISGMLTIDGTRQTVSTSELNSKSKGKKIGFFGRIQRFMRTVFRRRKN